MARLADAKARPTEGKLADANAPTKEYLERVAKYVPTEVVAAYVALLGFLSSASERVQPALSVAAFLLCLLVTPFYLGRMASPNQPKRKHQAVSTVAFGVWAYSIGGNAGVFGAGLLDVYDASIASFLLVAFTLLSGIPTPRPGER